MRLCLTKKVQSMPELMNVRAIYELVPSANLGNLTANRYQVANGYAKALGAATR